MVRIHKKVHFAAFLHMFLVDGFEWYVILCFSKFFVSFLASPFYSQILSKVTILGATDSRLRNKLFVEKGANLCASVNPSDAVQRDALSFSWVVDGTPK